MCVCVCAHAPVSHIFFIHLSVDGHLGCFHALAIVNIAKAWKQPKCCLGCFHALKGFQIYTSKGFQIYRSMNIGVHVSF